jgi:hypothetical protein
MSKDFKSSGKKEMGPVWKKLDPHPDSDVVGTGCVNHDIIIPKDSQIVMKKLHRPNDTCPHWYINIYPPVKK